MQQSARQFGSSRSEQTSQTGSGPLDPLLQFDSEERSATPPEREQSALSDRPPAAPPPAVPAEAVARPEPRNQSPDARSHARRLAWPVAAGATFAGVLAAVSLVEMNVPSRSSAQQQILPPGPAAAPVATPLPVEA